jgi:hypothetical protein
MGKYDDRVFLARRRTELAKSVGDKKRDHHIFPYKVYNISIIYIQFHLETNNYSIFQFLLNLLSEGIKPQTILKINDVTI